MKVHEMGGICAGNANNMFVRKSEWTTQIWGPRRRW